MAWRLVQDLENLESVCSPDAIAESTLLSEYYLSYRNAGVKARVVPVDEVARTIASKRIDVVTNIQNFTECTLDSIKLWLQLLSTAQIIPFFSTPAELRCST